MKEIIEDKGTKVWGKAWMEDGEREITDPKLLFCAGNSIKFQFKKAPQKLIYSHIFPLTQLMVSVCSMVSQG